MCTDMSRSGDQTRQPLSPAARHILDRIEELGVVHRQRYQEKRYQPITEELYRSGALVELGRGYLSTPHAIEKLFGLIKVLLPADSRTLAVHLELSHGSVRALLVGLAHDGRVVMDDGVVREGKP